MPAKIYRVTLSDEERACLEAVVRKGKSAARKITVARVLLKAAGGASDGEIVEALGVSRVTCERLRKRCVEEGVQSCLERKKRASVPVKVTGEVEARIVALACTKPPQGHARWTLRLLAHRVVELEYLDSISHETVGQVLKKKRAQAVEEGAVLHPAGGERRVRLRDGGHP